MKWILTVLSFVSMFAAAQDFPSKPIRMVLGMPASSTFPLITKAITANVPDKKMVFFNDHKVGQGNLVAYQFVNSSKPDGYTVGLASTSVVINPSLYKDAGYEATDFEPILFIGQVENGLLVHPSVPFNTVGQLLKYAKRGDVLYGHNGFATQSFLAMELLAETAGVRFRNIPYANRGTDTAMIDLFAGEIYMHLAVIGRVQGYVETKKVRLLATTGVKRHEKFPQTPTIGETVKGFSSFIWYALVVPKGTPDDVKKLLSTELHSGWANPNTKKVLQNLGVDPSEKQVPEIVQLIAQEKTKWAKVLKSKNIVPR